MGRCKLSFLATHSRDSRGEGNERRKKHGWTILILRGPLFLQKKKKKTYDDFFDCFVQHDKYHALETHTINRPSIRADSPLITNKYLTSSLHRVQTLLSTSVCVSSYAYVSNRQREIEVFYSLFFRICSSGVSVVWHRLLFLVGKDSSCIEWSNFFWNHGCACKGGEGNFPTSCQLPKIWGNSNCRGFPISKTCLLNVNGRSIYTFGELTSIERTKGGREELVRCCFFLQDYS